MARESLLLVWRWLWHPKIRLVLGVGLGLGVSYWLVRELDWRSLSVQFESFPVPYAIASLAIFMVAMALRAHRWQVLLLGERAPLHRLLLVQNAGIGLNSVSPVRVFAEALQYAMLTLRYRMKREDVAVTLGVQRVQDFIIGVLLFGIGLMLVPGFEDFTRPILGMAIVATLTLLAVPVIIWFGTGPRMARVPLVAATCTSLRHLVRARSKLTYSFLLTLGYWMLVGASAWVLAYGMGIQISVLVATVLIIGTVTFAGMIPSLPASLGTFEFAVYYLLTRFGVEGMEALGFALVIHAILFIPPILIASLVFLTWGIRKSANGEYSVGRGRSGWSRKWSAALTPLHAVWSLVSPARTGVRRTGLVRWGLFLISGK